MNAYKASIKNMSKNSFMENEQLENARITAENILRSHQLLNVKEPVKIVKAIQYTYWFHFYQLKKGLLHWLISLCNSLFLRCEKIPKIFCFFP